MACFLVPTAEAIVTTVAAKVLEKKEQKDQLKLTAPTTGAKALETQEKTAFSRKLMWLSYMLWGGAAYYESKVLPVAPVVDTG